MFDLKPKHRFVRTFRVSMAVSLAVGISCLARAHPLEQDDELDPTPPDAKLFFALGMIESGNDDRGIGRAGEISRYQIHPSVWRSYSVSRAYQNPAVSCQVAHQHWNYLINYFRDKTGR